MASDKEPKLVADGLSLCRLLDHTFTPLLRTTCTPKFLHRIFLQIKPALAELSALHDTCRHSKASHAYFYNQIQLAEYLVKLLRVLLPNVLAESAAGSKVASSCCGTGLTILNRICLAAVSEDHGQPDAAVLASSLLKSAGLGALTDHEPGEFKSNHKL